MNEITCLLEDALEDSFIALVPEPSEQSFRVILTGANKTFTCNLNIHP